jgi:hypothetical protein
MYLKHITIVNDNSRVVRMMLQVVASLMIVILMTLEASFMLLENNHSRASLAIVSYDPQNIFIAQATRFMTQALGAKSN